jgi:hypothetical protein
MIFFYKKDTGDIYSVIDGRFHNEQQLNIIVTDGDANIGKYIIGWIEKNNKKIAYNIDKFYILQKFEDITSESPLDYTIDISTGNITKKLD